MVCGCQIISLGSLFCCRIVWVWSSAGDEEMITMKSSSVVSVVFGRDWAPWGRRFKSHQQTPFILRLCQSISMVWLASIGRALNIASDCMLRSKLIMQPNQTSFNEIRNCQAVAGPFMFSASDLNFHRSPVVRTIGTHRVETEFVADFSICSNSWLIHPGGSRNDQVILLIRFLVHQVILPFHHWIHNLFCR